MRIFNDNQQGSLVKQGEYIQHGHKRKLDYDYEGAIKKCADKRKFRKLTRQETDDQIGRVKACITFFKTYAEDPNTSIEIRAAAKAAVVEDEERLHTLKKHKPWF